MMILKQTNMKTATTDTAQGIYLQGKWLNCEKVIQCIQTINGVRTYEIIKPQNYNID